MASDGFADDFLGAPAGVDIRRVDEIDALVPGLVDDAQRVLGVGLFANIMVPRVRR